MKREMKREAAEILKDALTLPSVAHAALAGSLVDNLDTEVDEDAEAACATEVNRRFPPRISVMLSILSQEGSI